MESEESDSVDDNEPSSDYVTSMLDAVLCGLGAIAVLFFPLAANRHVPAEPGASPPLNTVEIRIENSRFSLNREIGVCLGRHGKEIGSFSHLGEDNVDRELRINWPTSVADRIVLTIPVENEDDINSMEIGVYLRELPMDSNAIREDILRQDASGIVFQLKSWTGPAHVETDETGKLERENGFIARFRLQDLSPAPLIPPAAGNSSRVNLAAIRSDASYSKSVALEKVGTIKEISGIPRVSIGVSDTSLDVPWSVIFWNNLEAKRALLCRTNSVSNSECTNRLTELNEITEGSEYVAIGKRGVAGVLNNSHLSFQVQGLDKELFQNQPIDLNPLFDSWKSELKNLGADTTIEQFGAFAADSIAGGMTADTGIFAYQSPLIWTLKFDDANGPK